MLGMDYDNVLAEDEYVSREMEKMVVTARVVVIHSFGDRQLRMCMYHLECWRRNDGDQEKAVVMKVLVSKKSDIFLANSGASDHKVWNPDWLEDAREIVPRFIMLGDWKRVSARIVELYITDVCRNAWGPIRTDILSKNILYVPKLL